MNEVWVQQDTGRTAPGSVMGHGEEEGNESVPEDKGTKRKSSKGSKRSRTEGSNSATKNAAKEINEEGKKKDGNNRTTKSKDGSKDGKEKESRRRKKSRAESRGGNSSNLEEANLREKEQPRASRSRKDGEKKSTGARNPAGGNEESGATAADHVAGVRQAVALEELPDPANDSNGTPNTSTSPPSEEIDDGVGNSSSSLADELKPSPATAVVSRDDGDNKSRPSEKASTIASNSSASTRGSSRGDTNEDNKSPSSASSAGPSRAGETTNEGDSPPQSSSRVSKSKRHSHDKQRKKKSNAAVPSSPKVDDKKSIERGAVTTETPPSSTPSISSNATSYNTITNGTEKFASEQSSAEGGSERSIVAGEQGEFTATNGSADMNALSESMNDTDKKERNVSFTVVLLGREQNAVGVFNAVVATLRAWGVWKLF